MSENLARWLRLLLVTDDALLRPEDAVECCRAAVAGGVTAVQLRFKRLGDRELLALARQLVGALSVPLFINDRLDIALAVGAAGVHLGPDDLSPLLARRIVPAGFVIGASVGQASEVERGASADYWGIGPLRGSTTKRDAGAPLGWDGARALRDAAAGRATVVIGGVTPADAATAVTQGFSGVAVAGGVLAGEDPAARAAAYRAAAMG